MRVQTQNVTVLNSPARVFSVDSQAPLTMSFLTINDCVYLVSSNLRTRAEIAHAHARDIAAGDLPNSMSNGLPAGHNTDGFDVSAIDVTIENK